MSGKLFNSGTKSFIKKNVFDLSHERKLSMNMGQCVPMYLQEVVPGDKFKVSTESLVRLAPMLAPMMHRVNVHTHFFFVPNRLVWDNWQDFITGGPNGTLAPVLPQIKINATNYTNFKKGTILDYFGIQPTGDTAPSFETSLNALPFRAYQLIWQEYFRDQTLQTGYSFSTGDTVPTNENISLNQLQNRCWEKDYFTTSMPWAQRGPDVRIPMSGDIDYLLNSKIYTSNGFTGAANIESDNNGNVQLSSIDNARIENIETISNQSTIRDLRIAVRLQEWFEKNARGGARYVEQIMSHFGVRSSDARLQRPEFLGGGINPIVVSEVLSTAETTTLPQGNMSGHGIGVGHDNNFTKHFEEHGYVIGIISILPKTTYQQGIPRHFLKMSKTDFFWPEFANIGEQTVYDTELYHDYSMPVCSSTFGYQSRYSEYKFANNIVSGDFRDTLNYWHMGRLFDNAPALNASFVWADPTHRIFAVTDPDEHKLYVQLYNKVTAIRPMPQFGIPTI